MIAQRLLHQGQRVAKIGQQAAVGAGNLEAPAGGKLGLPRAVLCPTGPAFGPGPTADGRFADTETGGNFRQKQLAEAIFPFDALPVDTPPIRAGAVGGRIMGHRRAISGTYRLCTHNVHNAHRCQADYVLITWPANVSTAAITRSGNSIGMKWLDPGTRSTTALGRLFCTVAAPRRPRVEWVSA